METSQENFATIVCAGFGGQAEGIVDNWKIVNAGNHRLCCPKFGQQKLMILSHLGRLTDYSLVGGWVSFYWVYVFHICNSVHEINI